MSSFKPALSDALNDFLEPIRNRRLVFEKDPGYLREILDNGRDRVREIGSETLVRVRENMGMNYSKIYHNPSLQKES